MMGNTNKKFGLELLKNIFSKRKKNIDLNYIMFIFAQKIFLLRRIYFIFFA